MFAAAAAQAGSGGWGGGRLPGAGGRGPRPDPKSIFSGPDPSGFSRDPTSLRFPCVCVSVSVCGGGCPRKRAGPGTDPSLLPRNFACVLLGSGRGAAIVHSERRNLDSENRICSGPFNGKKEENSWHEKICSCSDQLFFPGPLSLPSTPYS